MSGIVFPNFIDNKNNDSTENTNKISEIGGRVRQPDSNSAKVNSINLPRIENL